MDWKERHGPLRFDLARHVRFRLRKARQAWSVVAGSGSQGSDGLGLAVVARFGKLRFCVERSGKAGEVHCG